MALSTIGTNAITDATIATGDIADSAVTTAKTNANITMIQQWRLTSSFTGNADPIASNWEQNDDASFDPLGSSMTQSSGIFTFPSTGIYRVDFQHIGTTENNNPSQYNEAHIRVTTNNSTYNSRATTSSLGITTNGTNGQFSSYCSCIVDVTNTSNVKIATYVEVADNGTSTIGGTDRQFTGITVIRLGDT